MTITERQAPAERLARSPVVGPSKPRLLEVLGPGLISGAADDDPTAIATYSQAGARFGYGLCWLMPLVYPLMVVVQQVSARVGRTTGHGLAGNIRRHYPGWFLYASVTLLLVANVVAIAADLSVMADALQLLVGGPHLLYVLLFGAFCVGTQIFMRYTRYVAVLKWTTLSLFAYFGALLMIEVPWEDVAAAMLAPSFTFEIRYVTTMVAIFGVALSPYLFFWQASQEVEDQRVKPLREPLVEAPEQASGALERIRLDTYIGMAVANLVGLAIIITAGTTLHVNGVTEVQTSAQAAEALRPIAGAFAFAIFSMGIIGTGLLAVPVLAGSAAYAIGEARKWPVGLARSPLEAKAFYATVAVATLAGIAANFAGLDPIRALYWSAVINGIVAAPVLAVMMWIAAQPRIMGDFTIGMPLKLGGWIATAVVAASVGAMGVAAGLEFAR
jgi:NRAMP (natural resistance-associated macrophage protein)-like metal ion transporter